MPGTIMEAPRLLHQHSEFGYTHDPSKAMRMEPEAVPQEVQSELSNRSRQVFEVTRAEDLARAETRSRVNRLRQFESEVRRRNLDPSRALGYVERGIDMLEQMARGTFAA